MAKSRTWVLGGGGSRGAAQVGVLLGLFEAGVDPPARIIGTSVGALNGAAIASYPGLAGAQMLEQVWMSDLALQVFRIHPLGLVMGAMRGERRALAGDNVARLIERVQAMIGHTDFKDLRIPLTVMATEMGSGSPFAFSSGPLSVALAASTAIPAVFPPVVIDGRRYADGGIVANTPLMEALNQSKDDILAISLMAGGDDGAPAATYTDLFGKTLQIALHHHMLSDYERVRQRTKTVVLCPVSATAIWDMRREHVKGIIDAARRATVELVQTRGPKLFSESGVISFDF